MTTAKLFRHGGSLAVRLPKAFRMEGTEVLIERHGDSVVLKPMTAGQFRSFAEIARHLDEAFPVDDAFPAPPPRPVEPGRAIPDLQD